MEKEEAKKRRRRRRVEERGREGMDEVPGSMGTSASFALRLGQTLFSSASLLFMSLGFDFYGYTAFW